MRSMGDLSWLNRYIGKPYKYGGRDVTGLDCYGLVKLIYKEQYNQNLPDWTTDDPIKAIAQLRGTDRP